MKKRQIEDNDDNRLSKKTKNNKEPLQLEAKFSLAKSAKELSERLFLACYNKRAEEALELIEKGANVNAVNKIGDTPLIYACINGMTEVALKLIEKGAIVNFLDKKGDNPLMYACICKMTEVVLKLIENGADVNAFDKDGYTPMFFACENHHSDHRSCIEIALKLIENGADVNAVNKKGVSILEDALDNFMNYKSSQGNFEILKFLLLHNAKIDSDASIKYIDKNLTNFPEEVQLLLNVTQFSDSLLNDQDTEEQLISKFKLNCEIQWDNNIAGRGFDMENICFITERIKNQILYSQDIKEVLKWTANLENNLGLLGHNNIGKLSLLKNDVCVFGSGKVIKPLWFRSLENLNEKKLILLQSEYNSLKSLFSDKLKFKAVKNLFDKMIIIPKYIDETPINSNDDQYKEHSLDINPVGEINIIEMI